MRTAYSLKHSKISIKFILWKRIECKKWNNRVNPLDMFNILLTLTTTCCEQLYKCAPIRSPALHCDSPDCYICSGCVSVCLCLCIWFALSLALPIRFYFCFLTHFFYILFRLKVFTVINELMFSWNKVFFPVSLALSQLNAKVLCQLNVNGEYEVLAPSIECYQFHVRHFSNVLHYIAWPPILFSIEIDFHWIAHMFVFFLLLFPFSFFVLSFWKENIVSDVGKKTHTNRNHVIGLFGCVTNYWRHLDN